MFFETLKYTKGTERTPKYVFVRIMKKDVMKIKNALEASPIPNQRIASGIQAIGGIGRKNSRTGLIKSANCLFIPPAKPKTTPANTPTRKPIVVLRRLAKTWGNIIPGFVEILYKGLNRSLHSYLV
jgi:hypothetical protein